MASIEEALVTEKLEPRQISAALNLSAEAGWNQTVEDWQIFISRGRVMGVFAANRRLIASAAILPYGAFGYVSMVLVTAAFRHRGIATRLLRDAIAALQAQSRTPVLDATPEGAAVYRPLGFREFFSMRRWQVKGRGGVTSDAAPATAADLPVLTE